MKFHHRWRETLPEKIFFMQSHSPKNSENKSDFPAPPGPPQPVCFYCAAPHAHSVELVGDFNQGRSLPMQRATDGWWFARLQLDRGCYHYRYSIDGRPVLDRRAERVVRNELNEPMSLMAVN